MLHGSFFVFCILDCPPGLHHFFLIGYTSHLSSCELICPRGTPHPGMSGQDNPTYWIPPTWGISPTIILMIIEASFSCQKANQHNCLAVWTKTQEGSFFAEHGPDVLMCMFGFSLMHGLYIVIDWACPLGKCFWIIWDYLYNPHAWVYLSDDLWPFFIEHI